MSLPCDGMIGPGGRSAFHVGVERVLLKFFSILPMINHSLHHSILARGPNDEGDEYPSWLMLSSGSHNRSAGHTAEYLLQRDQRPKYK